MSDANVLIGYVHEALPSYQPDDRTFFRRANDTALASLPADDAWPPLCRAMFSVTGDDSAHGSFRDRRLIHFAGHLNYIRTDIELWLPKFEVLLKRLYWLRAELFVLEAWSAGPIRISYNASTSAIESYSSLQPRPASEWQTTRTELDV